MKMHAAPKGGVLFCLVDGSTNSTYYTHMITQVVIRLDTKVKAKALKRAKREGVVFTDILKRAAESFAEGDFPGYSDEIRPEKLKQWEKASRDYDKGKGRTFNSIEELREHWKKL